MIKQARTKLPVDDSGSGFPKVQITYMGRTSTAKVLEPYGTHGSAPKDTAAILICINEDEGNKFIIPLSAQTRTKNLKEGEFECGNFKLGTTIMFDEEGNITIKAASGKNVIIDADDLIVGGLSFLHHIHSQAADSHMDTEQDTGEPHS